MACDTCGPERLGDRHAIEQVLRSYARAVDRADWELLRAAYHPDATDDHGGYRGGVDGFIDYVVDRHRDLEHSAHHLTNVSIEFAGDDIALVESYCHAFQRFGPGPQRVLAFGEEDPIVPPGAAGARVEAVLRYVDRFERRDGAWRIAARTVVSGDLRIEALEEPLRFGAERVVQRHDTGDHWYRELARLRAPRATTGAD